eukprot:364104-Chlamydomonas_euryale.AAC.5
MHVGSAAATLYLCVGVEHARQLTGVRAVANTPTAEHATGRACGFSPVAHATGRACGFSPLYTFHSVHFSLCIASADGAVCVHRQDRLPHHTSAAAMYEDTAITPGHSVRTMQLGYGNHTSSFPIDPRNKDTAIVPGRSCRATPGLRLATW